MNLNLAHNITKTLWTETLHETG